MIKTRKANIVIVSDKLSILHAAKYQFRLNRCQPDRDRKSTLQISLKKFPFASFESGFVPKYLNMLNMIPPNMDRKKAHLELLDTEKRQNGIICFAPCSFV